jgi:hypothetical protein
MGRLPEVFVRPATMTEGRRLQDRASRPGPGQAAPGDRGADVGAGPERAGHRAPAGLLSGVCAWGDPRVQRHRVQGPEPDVAEIMWNYSSGLEK